jgi:prepilin-type N-terminal cleavage/methylation domain-containing protein
MLKIPLSPSVVTPTAAGRKRQRGMTLIETMVALVIGLIVAGAMLTMMANTLGTGTRTIEMARLQQEMRTVMQLVTRDVRRSAYNAEAIRCFGNIDCGSDGTFPNGLPGEITINAANNCFLFEMDRDHDGDPTDDAPGGFRLVTANGTGRIQVFTGAGDTTCTSTSDDWIDVTDPELVDVQDFRACLEIDGSDDECNGLLEDGAADPNVPDSLSFSDVVEDDGAGNLTYQRTRKLYLAISAELIGQPDIAKTLVDVIQVRNDIILM